MNLDRIKSILKKVLFVRNGSPQHQQPAFDQFIRLENEFSQNHIWMYLRTDSYMEREFFENGLYGKWEKESLKIWAVLCKRANNILDIGANTGVFSLIAQSQNPNSTVYAIEPVDINFGILSKNIQRNNYNIHAEKVALSGKDGIAKMFMLKDRLNYMTSVNDNRYDKHPEIAGDCEVVEIEVAIKTYQYLLDKYHIPKIDLLKIDVEGHEVDVLKTMYQYLDKDKPVILIEVIGDENAVELNRMFSELGYKFISINEEKKSVVVDRLWDNDHHNFLLCNDEVIKYLQEKQLVV